MDRGASPDESLHHEMVHALRNMQGKFNAIPTKNQFYDSDEEFLAIVATNVYISAKGGTQFRAHHHGHERLQSPLNTSSGFLTDQDNLDLMNIYRLSWDRIFLDLSIVVSAKFNPFRELTNNLAYLGPLTSRPVNSTTRMY
jgi:hypothetical protein